MENPQAGWYPDPEGDPNKLRYWDGAIWTNNYAVATSAQQPNPAQPQQSTQTQNQQPYQATQNQEVPYHAVSTDNAQQANEPFDPYQPSVQQTPPVPPNYAAQGVGYPGAATYPMTKTDHTLRLIAFIFAVISTVISAVALIPLIWMIPMTYHCWGIYKGTQANTVFFGVCCILFLGLIAGILLLCSTKDR